MISDKESNEIIRNRLNKQIVELKIINNVLIFKFADDTVLNIKDVGQSCCESRYMNCDDDLDFYIGSTLLTVELGSTLLTVELGDSSEEDKDYGYTEIQFLKIGTSKGTFTVANYNEHNGYYGGFWISASNL